MNPAPTDDQCGTALDTRADHYVDAYLDELLGEALPVEAVPAPPAAVAQPAPQQRIAQAPALAPVAEPVPEAVAVAAPPSDCAGFTPLAQSTRWLRVAVGADSYALQLLRVQEVVRVAPIVHLRGAAPAVLGVMNLRGRIVPVFDLGRWLGTGGADISDRARIVVVERANELIGVLVGAVDDVVTLGRERIEPPMVGNTPGAMADAIVGISRVGATPTVLLDANAVFG